MEMQQETTLSHSRITYILLDCFRPLGCRRMWKADSFSSGTAPESRENGVTCLIYIGRDKGSTQNAQSIFFPRVCNGDFSHSVGTRNLPCSIITFVREHLYLPQHPKYTSVRKLENEQRFTQFHAGCSINRHIDSCRK
jgi:hypothetical protein